MKKLNISGKQLRKIGYPESPVISLAMNIVNKHFKHNDENEVLKTLQQLLQTPEDYLEDETLAPIAIQLNKDHEAVLEAEALELGKAVHFTVYGTEHIEQGALQQMYTAAKLPISVAGAIMPDAHHGYGLPIGGVLATKNAVIPYGVGVDIGCRMCLSIFDIAPSELTHKVHAFSRELNEATLFGSGAQFQKPADHEIMEDEAFYQNKLLKQLHSKAWKQLGSSGSGNHFVEFGVVEIKEQDDILDVAPGKYIGLLSHSGSRALGASIAEHFTKLAKAKRNLPAEAKNLAWLNLHEEEGQEYWLAMNLAGAYASACHQVIHHKIAKSLGRKPLTVVENHHNFAWKEMLDGEEVVVHRKGATPAGKNVLGIIPGSMTANGYIVKGRGEASSINSASHGAGRKMSRTKALESITKSELIDVLAKHHVTLLGGGLDEAPFAYKDIDLVMQSQTDLVDIVGSFTPKIVKMDGAAPRRRTKE